MIIMKIKMDNLVITEYCSQDKRKIRFIKDISEDQLIRNYISNYIYDQLEASEGENDIRIGHSYIIEDKRKLIGFIRLAFLDSNGVLQLHYGVHPDHRKNHYGSKILTESSKYIFKRFLNVNKIELYIKQFNIGSIKCAENANFKMERDFKTQSDCLIKIYAKSR